MRALGRSTRDHLGRLRARHRRQVTIEIAGRILRLDAGQEVMLPAGVRHTVRNVGGTSARWLYGYRLPGLTA